MGQGKETEKSLLLKIGWNTKIICHFRKEHFHPMPLRVVSHCIFNGSVCFDAADIFLEINRTNFNPSATSFRINRSVVAQKSYKLLIITSFQEK